jgi:hypothetical protein
MAERGAGLKSWSLSPTQISYSGAGQGPGWFGPLAPRLPAAPPEVAGRQWDFPSGFNTADRPKAYEPIGFPELRGLADGYDMLRIIIETRKDQVARMKWTIRSSDDKKNTKVADKTILDLIKFFRKPDGQNGWGAWIRMILEDLFVLDAPAVYRQRNMGGDLIALHPLDGSTIKKVIDDWGRTPQPFLQGNTMVYPVAYQQILKGMPAIDYSTRDLIYRPRNPRTGRAYGYGPVEQILMTINIALRRQMFQLQYYCYSDDTEVLTRRGWLRFADTHSTDEFATRKIGTGEFEWQKAYDAFYKHYTGKMVHFTGRSLDMLVTPHHRMLVNSLPRGLNRVRNYKSSEHVLTAEELATYGTMNTGIPLTSHWAGTEIGTRIFEDSDPRSKSVTMSGDDYCAFMGMYLAEGNLHHKGSIAISQPPDGRGAHETYRALLEKIFTTGVCYSGHQFEVCRKSLASFLRQFGKAQEKFIPDDIREATPRQIGIFLDYYLLGDGRALGDDGVSTQQAFTVSRKFADHLTEVGQKIGRAPLVWTRKAGAAFVGTREVKAREGYMVSFARMAATKGWSAEEVDYDAPVACVCVPNKFLYVRRNGKAAWSGNTEGNIPEALIGVPDVWNPDQIKAFQDYWDQTFSGNGAARRHAKFVPGGVGKTFIQTKEAELKNVFDEWLARVISFAFSIPPTPFVAQSNRATANSAKQTAEEEGLAPILNWIKGVIDDILVEDFDRPDLEFSWSEDEETDPVSQQTMLSGYTNGGLMTRNEAREKLGLDRDLDPAADQLMITTGSGAMPIGSFEIARQDTQVAADKAAQNAKDIAAGAPVPGPIDQNAPAPKPGEPKAPAVKKPAENPIGADTKVGKGMDDALDAAFDLAKRATKTRSIAPIPFERAATIKPMKAMQKAVAAAFTKTAASVAEQIKAELSKLGKAADDKMSDAEISSLSDRIVASLTLDDLAEMIGGVGTGLSTIVTDTVQRAFAQLGVDAESDLVGQVNARAVAAAEDRAAELVGMVKDADGAYVASKTANMAIDDATRNMIRETISKGLVDNIGSDEIATLVQEGTAFSEERAALITRTEISRANSAAALDSYQAASSIGVKVKKQWLLGEHPCPTCLANSMEGAIDLDAVFSSSDQHPPAHPRCECALSPVVED